MPRIFIRRDLSLWTLVSPDDYSFLVQWTWGLQIDNRGKLYVRRYRGSANIYLHRIIMRRVCKAPSEKHLYVDHINNNGLDNRRENLRWATPSENAKNLAKDGVSGGVHGLAVLRGLIPPTPSEYGEPMDVPGFDAGAVPASIHGARSLEHATATACPTRKE